MDGNVMDGRVMDGKVKYWRTSSLPRLCSISKARYTGFLTLYSEIIPKPP